MFFRKKFVIELLVDSQYNFTHHQSSTKYQNLKNPNIKFLIDTSYLPYHLKFLTWFLPKIFIKMLQNDPIRNLQRENDLRSTPKISHSTVVEPIGKKNDTIVKIINF